MSPSEASRPRGRVRRWVIRVLEVVLAVAVVAVILIGGFIAWNWTFLKRVVTYPSDAPVTTVSWYEPKERVAGSVGTPLPTAEPGALGVRPEAIAEAAAYAERKKSSALLVVYRGKLVGEYYWRGYHRGSFSNSMSMAKSVLALAIGVAQAEGRLGPIDEPASRHLREWADAPDARRRITLRHLLQMASGLRHDDSREEDSDMLRIYFGRHIGSYALGIPSVSEPGRAFEYNNPNSQVLGAALERATGERYASFLSRALWKPLGLSDGWLWLDRPGGTAHTFCCLFATPHDWAKLGLLVLHEGRYEGKPVVPREWIAAMRTPSPREPDYGLHLWVGSNQGGRREDSKEPFAAPDLVYFDGADKQRVYIIPSRDLVVVRLGEQARDWDDSFLPNTVLKGIIPATGLPETGGTPGS